MAATRRIYYESLQDPDAAGPYLNCLASALDARARDGVSVTVAGRRDQRLPARHASGIAATCRSVLSAQSAGFDAFVLGNVTDLGVREAQSHAKIPVIGLGESILSAAMRLTSPIGVVAVDSYPWPTINSQRERGKSSARSPILLDSANVAPDQLLAAFSDDAQTHLCLSQFVEAADRLRARGARLLLPAGGILIVLLDRAGMTSAADLPIVDGLTAALDQATAGRIEHDSPPLQSTVLPNMIGKNP